MLRGEIEGLQASAYSARAQSARLSSQLAKLQGTIETRLAALSAAFDAYVELGDVREQLAGYPDTSAVRRDAVSAIDILSHGGRPEPLAHRDLDYWLSYAVNAVIALVGGGSDAGADQRAVELSGEAEIFIVAAAGALGAGQSVATRVPALLVCDGTLTPRQLVLWQAVVDGVFGDGVMPHVGNSWRASIEMAPGGWVAWVRACSRTSTPLQGLSWLDTQTTIVPGPTTPPENDASNPALDATSPRQRAAAARLVLSGADPGSTSQAAPDSRAGLRNEVITLVGQGMGEEATLLSRSRSLRAKIEDPTGPDARTTGAEAPLRSVTDVVRETFLSASADSSVRRELLGWLQPGLTAATAALAETASMVGPAEVTVRTEGGSMEVTENGADPQRVARAEQTLAELNAVAVRGIIVPGVAAGASALLALVFAVTDHPVGAWLMLLLGLVLGAMALNALRLRRLAERRLASKLTEMHARLAEGQETARAVRRLQQEEVMDAAGLAAAVTARLRNRSLVV